MLGGERGGTQELTKTFTGGTDHKPGTGNAIEQGISANGREEHQEEKVVLEGWKNKECKSQVFSKKKQNSLSAVKDTFIVL